MTRKLIRPAFITTVAAAASVTLLMVGCSTNVQFADEGSDCTFGDPGCDQPCPTEAPADGSLCRQDQQTCYWDNCETGLGHNAECDDGKWQVDEYNVACNPPPPDPPACPATRPEPNSFCEVGWDGPYTCFGYEDPFCMIEVSATCELDGTWNVEQIDCNPPPPDFCQEITSVDECGTTPGCAWRVPGCGDPALPVAGCFSEYECSTGTCGFEETCTAVVIDPCWNSSCQACGQNVSLCLPSG